MTGALQSSTALTPAGETNPLKKDFRNFLFVVWKHLNLPDPTPVQYDIAHFLQHGPRRCVIEAFRGVGKSWITSAFVAWLLYCNPQLNILVVSASKIRADDFSTFTLRLILEIEFLRHLAPKEGQRQSKIAFDVGPADADHAPSVKSVGITGQLAGSRADIIIPDDIEVPNNSDTQLKRDKLAEAIKEFDAILKPGGRTIFLGTPQSEMSVYNLLPERGYEIRIWPARVPTKEKADGYHGRLAPMIMGMVEQGMGNKPTDRLRFADEDLMEREASYGRSGFSLQFMLDTTLSDLERYPLRLSDLVVLDLDREKAPADLAWSSDPRQIIDELPNVGMGVDRYYSPIFVSEDWAPYQGIIMAVDPSGRGKDETAYAVVAFLHGRLFLLDVGGYHGGYSRDTLESLSRTAKAYKVNLIIHEPNFGDGMFAQLLQPVLNGIYPCTIEETARSNAQKERRIIDNMEPVMNQHRLVVDKKLIERDYRSTENRAAEDVNRYRLFYQMTRLTKDRGSLSSDDRIDALAMAVHYWTERMALDADKEAEDMRARLLEEELRKFVDHAVGVWGDGSPDTFFSIH